MSLAESIKKLRKLIQGFGSSDKYIDQNEEQDVFDKGQSLEIDRATIEAILNQICRDNGWIREKDIVPDIYDQLDEATMDDGVINRKEFDHSINYAVAMNMPRKRAMQLSVKYVLDKRLAIKKPFLGRDWFEALRRQYTS
ncbi:hypothetical protein N9B54_03115 [Mariniblastus sp.]|nr:hypothetical protein [Mariniblastus sp.]